MPLLDAGAKVDFNNKTWGTSRDFIEYDVTPLFAAVALNHTFVVEILLAEGKADPDIPNRGSRYPIHWAVLNANKAIVDMLIAANADLDVIDRGLATATNGDTSMHYALGIEPVEIQVTFVECLLKGGACPDIPNGANGDTPLHIAARLGKLAIVELLLEFGADAALRNNVGETPLDAACTFTDDSSMGCADGKIMAMLEAKMGGEAQATAEIDCENPADSEEKLKCALEGTGGGSNGTASG
ncbi:unnamed protein product [Ostreobium quekettii]|uniref:Uncharacterized protein n=1 Tax=Ostreobium quekettii TaxID=121088 RepID=A0A8S1J7E3_9CHLO|nr:unnamed protein product [Ostreobium quekettii]